MTDTLIDRGDREVAHTVSADHGARLSVQGIGQLIEKGRTTFDLCELLVDRPDLSQGTSDALLPVVSERLAIKLAERGYDVRG